MPPLTGSSALRTTPAPLSPTRGARLLRELRWLGAAVTVSALGVMLLAGLHAASLGPNPAWAFDCSDTACEDEWLGPRLHYRAVTAWAVAVGFAGWALTALTLPRYTRRSILRMDHPRLILLALVAPPGAVVLILLVRPSVPMLVCTLATGGFALSLVIWGALREQSGWERRAWVAAGAVVGASALAGLVITGMLFPVLFLFSPFVGLAGGLLALGGATWLAGRLLLASAAEAPGPAAARWGHDPSWLVAVRMAVVAAMLLAVGVAGAPVEAPPDYESPRLHRHPFELFPVSGSDDEETTSPPAAPESTALESTAPESPVPTATAPAPPAAAPAVTTPALPSAAHLPPCRASSLTFSVTDWGRAMGSGLAIVTARNDGRTACGLTRRPKFRIVQGGRPLALRVAAPLTSWEDPGRSSPAGVALAPGQSAQVRIAWPGYQSAIDETSPQQLSVSPTAHGPARPVDLHPRPLPLGLDPGPAPFDIAQDVPGGAVIEVGTWAPAP